MSKAQKRANRLQEMERLYSQRAYSDNEMATRMHVTRPTVWKDRQELERHIPFVRESYGRYRIDRDIYISEIRVNVYEALMLYLAARRVSRQTQIAQPHVAGALEKLATALRQPMAKRLVETADTILDQKSQPERIKMMETIARGWVENIKVRIVYQALEAQQSKTHIVAPYLIEPSHWSDSTYLIGHSNLIDDILPFKLERIARATLTTEQFAPPEAFDEQILLKHAWGIWYTEKEPVQVRLRFAPGRATRRVKESIWHPTEEVTDTDDGGCIWQTEVDEWQEMLPWIRAWGSDCEVLEPIELRETLMGEAKAMAEQYGWHVSSQATNTSSTLDDFFGI